MKKCCKCNEIKPLGEFNSHKGRPDGLSSHCKACQKVVAKKQQEANKQKYDLGLQTVKGEKRCSTCKRTLPIEQFSKSRLKHDGVGSQCKDCNKKACTLHYNKNKDRTRQKRSESNSRSYYKDIEESRRKRREISKAYYQRKRDLVGPKKCLKCGEQKEAECFGRRREPGGDGLKDICKPCTQQIRTERIQEKLSQRPIPFEQQCWTCKAVKPITEFYPSKSNMFGVDRHCKPCMNKRSVEIAKRNPEKKNEARRAYHAANPDKIREYEKRYAERFPEKVKAKKRAGHCRRKKRAKENGGSFTGAQILEMVDSQRNQCVYCGVDFTATGYHIDHIYPLSKGGSNNIENIQLLCPSCNLKKSDKCHDDFIVSKKPGGKND